MPEILSMRGRRGVVPPGAVYIGGPVRWVGLAGSKWRNPYRMDRDGDPRDGTRDEVVEKFRVYLLGNPELLAALPELRGRDLACRCAPARCHGEVLLELANV